MALSGTIEWTILWAVQPGYTMAQNDHAESYRPLLTRLKTGHRTNSSMRRSPRSASRAMMLSTLVALLAITVASSPGFSAQTQRVWNEPFSAPVNGQSSHRDRCETTKRRSLSARLVAEAKRLLGEPSASWSALTVEINRLDVCDSIHIKQVDRRRIRPPLRIILRRTNLPPPPPAFS